jgi:GR25 family glycosyltransferase involved in LPS biosynthesis
MNKIYNLMDKIYCINLISRNDRYELMQNFEKEENIKLTYYRPKKHNNGRIGCFISHIEVIKDAYINKYKYIMIFEDDIIKTPSYNKINYTEIEKFIKRNEWDIIKLSSSIYPIHLFKYNDYNHLYNGNSLMGNAYILNKESINKIINTYTKYINDYHIDSYYTYIFKNIYNVIPIIFDQKWNLESDNEWEWTYNKVLDRYIRNILNNNLLYYISIIKYNNNYLILIMIMIIIYILHNNT